ncbi:2253_t:CDS:1, partial [Dentiscutata heterogama]
MDFEGESNMLMDLEIVVDIFQTANESEVNNMDEAFASSLALKIIK